MSLKKNTFCSMNIDKIREKIIFEIVHCPFEMPSNYITPAGFDGAVQLSPQKDNAQFQKFFLI